MMKTIKRATLRRRIKKQMDNVTGDIALDRVNNGGANGEQLSASWRGWNFLDSRIAYIRKTDPLSEGLLTEARALGVLGADEGCE